MTQRRNITQKFTLSLKEQEGEQVSYEIKVSTRPACWLDTNKPVLLPFSIHSAIYNGLEGKAKIAGFIQSIKNRTNGNITILFCEKAHLEAISLKYENNLEKAFLQCCEDGRKLKHRFQEEIKGCQIMHWADFVDGDENYPLIKEKVLDLYRTSDEFRSKLRRDAERTLVHNSGMDAAEQEIFLHKTELDLIEQCVGLLVISSKGYKYQFYPGRSNESMIFLNDYHIDDDKKVIWVNVKISDPKKISFREAL